MKSPIHTIPVLSVLSVLVTAPGCGGDPIDPTDPSDPALSPTAGTYRMQQVEATARPPGCVPAGGGREEWRFDLAPDPAGYLLRETYAAAPGAETFVNEYPCEHDGHHSRCQLVTGHDYSAQGLDAVVSLQVVYEFRPASEVRIEGDALVALDCSGEACGAVASHWRATAFPCRVDSTLAGELE